MEELRLLNYAKNCWMLLKQKLTVSLQLQPESFNPWALYRVAKSNVVYWLLMHVSNICNVCRASPPEYITIESTEFFQHERDSTLAERYKSQRSRGIPKSHVFKVKDPKREFEHYVPSCDP